MNKLFVTIALQTTMIASLSLLSCNEEDDFSLTGEEGRPSSFRYANDTWHSFFYENSRLSHIRREDGSATTFTYDADCLRTVSFEPPRGVADGHGSILFKKEGASKIRVESSGEPSFELYVKEIELDENRNPVRITDIGVYSRGPQGLEKVHDGERYVNITLDPSTKSILKMEVYDIGGSEVQTTYSYQYDNSPGTMSRVNSDLWFSVYWAYTHSYPYNTTDLQFFNYANNMIKETIIDKIENKTLVLNANYTYTKKGFPVAVSTDASDGQTMTIRY